MSDQANFDFEALPRPLVREDYIRSTDVEIKKDPLYGANQYKFGNMVLDALVTLSGHAQDQFLYPPTRVGYMKIAAQVSKQCGRKPDKSTVKFTVGKLLELGYVKYLHEAEHGTDAIEYRALTMAGTGAMFHGVHATHFRLTNGGGVQLIAARTR